jgi:hypothetical protein
MVDYNHTLKQAVFGTPSDRVQLIPMQGPAFYLVSRPGARVSLVERQVFTSAMNIARTKLNQVHTLVVQRIGGALPGGGIVPPVFDNLLEYCFRHGGAALLQPTLTRIRLNLERMRTGLSDPDTQIVDTNPAWRNAGGASGYVSCAFSERFRSDDPHRERSSTGRIHVRFSAYNSVFDPVNSRNAAHTIIHEASHKFCGTRDWVSIANSTGYFAMVAQGLNVPMQPLLHDQALNNAYSYEEFVAAMP